MQSNISDIHATARLYAEAGIPVFPCHPLGKKPATNNGFHDATTNLDDIDAWWTKNPDYNLAICPANSNLFVLDIDPGADMESLGAMEPTYTVRTPRGGWHYYFEGVGATTTGKVAPHVDTRSIGGYVLVPPSVTSDGRYTLSADIDYAPLPGWMNERIKKSESMVRAAEVNEDLPENVARAERLLKRYAEIGHVSVVGSGGDALCYEVCCEMLDLGLSVGKAAEMMDELWNPYCAPRSWEFDKLVLKLENALRYKQNGAGAYAIEPPKEVFGDIVKKLGIEGEPEKLSRFHFKDEAELDNEPDPKWLVKDLISEASTVMMYGASGSYKSFIALMLCLSIATGSETFGSKTAPGLVFYGALEGRAHLRKARKAWRLLKETEGKIENFFLGLAPMIGVDGEIQEFGDQIAKRCAGKKPSLIVIDTLTKSMAGMNENDASDAGKFIRFCDSLIEAFGCSVLAIHHTGKEEGRGARGSSAFFAGFDSVIEVKAHKATKAVSVYVKKHKDAEEREAPWTFEGRITGPSLTFEETTPEQHRVLIGDSKTITPKTVGAVLKKLNAFGQEASVTTAVLASELTIGREDESLEDWSSAIARTSRALQPMAKGILEAYVHRQGKNLLWSLPAAGD